MISTSILTKYVRGNLSYKARLPFNYTAPVKFFLVYTHQWISAFICAMANVGCDTLICRFLMHICCQFDILEQRLTKMSHNHEILRDCICHHDYIFELVSFRNSIIYNIIPNVWKNIHMHKYIEKLSSLQNNARIIIIKTIYLRIIYLRILVNVFNKPFCLNQICLQDKW